MSHGIYCLTEEQCADLCLFNRLVGHSRCVNMATLQTGGFYLSANFCHLSFSDAFA